MYICVFMEDAINSTLAFMAEEVHAHREELLALNREDVAGCDQQDIALYDRLHMNNQKIDGMIESLKKVEGKNYPVGKTLYAYTHPDGIEIENKTVPFGTILIVYESRPDVTVEATAIALKSGNNILLKGGKEARRSNKLLHTCWVHALEKAGLSSDKVIFLDMDRSRFQDYLKEPGTSIDLIIPRGGDRLIEYVRSVASCPVLVSGRGNNFLYVSDQCDREMAHNLIVQSKISKISACNALDKVLVNKHLPTSFLDDLMAVLEHHGVEIISNPSEEMIWYEEFLDKRIVISSVNGLREAIDMINHYSGQHSATIVTSQQDEADLFLDRVDCAAVYHNASTRYTDGFQFGLGAEMAISTEKLHHRGPLGIEHLVTNKWYIKGNGQTR